VEDFAEGDGKPVAFGPFDLHEVVGQGGMGVVYKAWQRDLERFVALKLLPGGPFEPVENRERFLREGRAAAPLHHTCIVTVLGAGEHQGHPYLVMDYIGGESLAKALAGKPFPVRQAVEHLVDLADAVAHAHSSGILHRDLKPSNVLFDVDGRPRITDFGLARRLAPRAMPDAGAAGEGAPAGDGVEQGFPGPAAAPGSLAWGTPSYAAPEQATGSGLAAKEAVDVWGLGMLLYEMLTGRRAFEDGPPPGALPRRARRGPVRPMALNRAVDRDLEAICLKCLEFDPARRYASPRDLREDLIRWQKHQPVAARPAAPAHRLLKLVQRHPFLAGVAAVLFASTVVILGGTLFYLANLRRAEAELLRGQGDLARAAGHLRDAGDYLLKAANLSRKLGEPPLATDLSLLDLHRGSVPPLLTLTGHVGAATCVALARDGQMVYSGGKDGTIRSWSLPLGLPEKTCLAHTGGVTCLVLAPDGRLISGGADGKLCIWQASDLTLTDSFRAHSQGIRALAVSPRGDGFATAGSDGLVRWWRGSSRQEDWVMGTTNTQVLSLSYTGDGGRLAAGTESDELWIWDLDRREAKRRRDKDDPGVYAAYCGSESVLIIGDSRGYVNRPAQDRTIWPYLSSASMPTTALAPVGQRQRALTGASDGTISLWSWADFQVIRVLRLIGHTGAVTALAASMDGEVAASAGQDGTVRIWKLDPSQVVPRATDARNFVLFRTAFSPDGLVALSAGQNGHLELHDAVTGAPLGRLEGCQGVVADAVFSPDGRQLASAGRDGTVRLWDLMGLTEVGRLTLPGRPVRCVAFSTDGRFVFAGERARETEPKEVVGVSFDALVSRLHVWDLAAKREVRSLPAHYRGVTSLAVSPDGRSLLTGGGDGTMRLWEIGTWEKKLDFAADEQAVNAVAFTPDGTRFVSAGRVGGLTSWGANDGRKLGTFPGLRDEPLCLAASPDGAVVAAGTHEGNLCFWDISSRNQLHIFGGAADQSIFSVSFAATGNRVASVGGDMAVTFWDTSWASEWRAQAANADQAGAALRRNAQDRAALRALARYYEFRRAWAWAAELYERLDALGAEVPRLSLARCLWLAGLRGRAMEVPLGPPSEVLASKLARRLQERALGLPLDPTPEEVALKSARRLQERALGVLGQAMVQREGPAYYLELCHGALKREIEDLDLALQEPTPEPPVPPSAHVIQPGPAGGKDVWCTEVLSGRDVRDDDGLQALEGSGSADHLLQVGGFGDRYVSQLEFDLRGAPRNAVKAELRLCCCKIDGGGPPMRLERILSPWRIETNTTPGDLGFIRWTNLPPVAPGSNVPLPSKDRLGWVVIDITELYNAWQSKAVPNYGLRLAPCFDPTNQLFYKFFSSRYTNNPALRPKLVVTTAAGGPLP